MGWGWLSQTRPIPRSPDGDKKSNAETAFTMSGARLSDMLVI